MLLETTQKREEAEEKVVEEMCRRYVESVRSSTPVHVLQVCDLEFPDPVAGAGASAATTNNIPGIFTALFSYICVSYS